MDNNSIGELEGNNKIGENDNNIDNNLIGELEGNNNYGIDYDVTCGNTNFDTKLK